MGLEPFRIATSDERHALLDERLRTTVWADELAPGDDDPWRYGVSGPNGLGRAIAPTRRSPTGAGG